MNETILLLQVLGPDPIYTTNVEIARSLSREQTYKLYNHAKINKIGYTFLNALEKAGILRKYPELESELKKQREIYKKYMESIRIIDEVLTDLGIDHVFIKTIYSFPVLPSDIDVLINEKLSKNLLELLKKKGFIIFDRGPHFVSVYNTIIDPHAPRDKMSYDIDIYDEISLNYVVYLDKEYCFNDLKIDLDNFKKVPSSEYELLIHLNHSIFEHLYTLLHFYTFMKLLSDVNIVKLKRLAKATRSDRVLSYTSTITLSIITSANLAIERKLLRVLEDLADEESPIDVNTIPYRYTLTQILRVLFEKAKKPRYSYHMLNFILHLINPKQLNHVVNQLIVRRRRQTY
jgi:hypothetical protein